MWYCWLIGAIITIIIGIILLFVGRKKLGTVEDDVGFLITGMGVLITALSFMIIIGTSCGGINNYAQIPRIHKNIQLEEVNKVHYHEAMKYNLGDESNERKSASHVRWFHNGDFSEAKDNKTWKQNYDDWFYNKSLITYHKMELKYYEHPVRNWRDGISMNSLEDSIHKPINY